MLKLGAFVKVDSRVAQIVSVDKKENLFLCRWLLTPAELPDSALAPPRTRQTFGRAELVMCDAQAAIQTDAWQPPENLAPTQVGREAGSGEFFYRQTFDPATGGLRPELPADVIQPSGVFWVENPDSPVEICQVCSRKFQVISGASTCAECVRSTWAPVGRPADEKRQTVVRKFQAAFNLAISEIGIVPEFVGDEARLPGLAAALEAGLWETGDYWPRARSLVFNLTDARNPHLRRRVVFGQVPLTSLVRADPLELASEELRTQRKIQQDKYYHQQVLLGAALEAPEPEPKKPRIDSPETSAIEILAALVVQPPPKTQRAPAPPAPRPPQRQASSLASELLQDCDRLENPRVRDAVRAVLQR